MSDSYTSSSYYYSSTTNTTDGTTTSGHRYTTTSHTDPDGNTVVRTAHQDLGQPAIVEERRYDRTGQEQQPLLTAGPGTTSAGGTMRITDLDEEQGTGATAYDPGTSYGGPEAGAAYTDNSYDSDLLSLASVSAASDLFGIRAYNSATGAYSEYVGFDADGVTRQRRSERTRRYHDDVDLATTGYSTTPRVQREYVNPDTGMRLRRETDVDISEVV